MYSDITAGGKMRKIKSFMMSVILYSALVVLVFPILVLILWSFAKSWSWPGILPKGFSLRGFQSVLGANSEMINILFGSIILSLVVTLITVIISIPAAKAIGLYKFKGKKLINMLILAPIIVPTVSVSMGIHLTFMRVGLANTFLGVVLVHLLPCLPYGVRILTNVFEIIGESMEYQGKVLGAGTFQIFWHITLPMIMPGILSAASLIFIVSFSQYFLTFLIGGGNVITFPMVMLPYIQGGDRVLASSYSLVFLVTTLLVLIIVEKSIKSHYKMENHFYI
jgi:putative spermidine/putrescine transport system permease protein